MARTKGNTQNDTKTRTIPWRNRHLEKKLFVCVFRSELNENDKSNCGSRLNSLLGQLYKGYIKMVIEIYSQLISCVTYILLDHYWSSKIFESDFKKGAGAKLSGKLKLKFSLRDATYSIPNTCKYGMMKMCCIAYTRKRLHI